MSDSVAVALEGSNFDVPVINLLSDQAHPCQDDEFLHRFRLNLAQRSIVRPSAEFWRSKRAQFICDSMRTPHGE